MTQGCGDPVSSKVARKGKFKVKNWLKYEFKQLKTFSYGNSQIKDNQHVIGFEPSWLIYDSLYMDYPFQLMSDLVIGEYDLNPSTGFARNDSALKAYRSKDIIQIASAVNDQLNVLLAVTDYGDGGYRQNFLSEIPKKNLFNSLDLILDEFNEKRGGNDERQRVGLLVDFPNVAYSHRNDFAEFLARVKKDLDNKDLGKSCLLYVVLPPAEKQSAIYKDSIFAEKVRKSVDLFVLRGHTFGDSIIPFAKGSMLPLERPGDFADVDSLVSFYNKTAKIPLSRLCLEFPYYATVRTDSGLSGHRALVPLSEVFNTVLTPRLLDTTSLSFRYKPNDTSYYVQDTLSLNIAYKWVVKNKLGGIGLYGLGYGHGMDNPLIGEGLWQTVADNFGEPAPRLFFPGISYLLCFLGVGIVSSVVVNWEVRYALREKRTKLWFYTGLLLCTIFAVVMCALPVSITSVMWKLVSLVILLIFPLGRKAFKFFALAVK
jgi:hypothetical protein